MRVNTARVTTFGEDSEPGAVIVTHRPDPAGRPVTYRRQQFLGADRTGSGISGISGIRILRLANWIGQARERRDEGQGGELAGRLLTRASSRLPGYGLPIDREGGPGGEASPVSGFLERRRGTEPLRFEVNDGDRHIGPLSQRNESGLPDRSPIVVLSRGEKDLVQFPGLQHTAREAALGLRHGGRGDGLGPACGLESDEEVVRGEGRPVRDVRGRFRLVPWRPRRNGSMVPPVPQAGREIRGTGCMR